MGKKSSTQASMKQSKHEKKQNLNSLIKILRPKVYITDTSNFKKLVQELTGNGKYTPVASSPVPPPVSLSPPPETEAYYHHQHHHNLDNNVDLSFDSCFTTSLEAEGSPDYLSQPGFLKRGFENTLNGKKMNFYKDLETMLMEMDSSSCDYDDQVCVYDYDLSTFI